MGARPHKNKKKNKNQLLRGKNQVSSKQLPVNTGLSARKDRPVPAASIAVTKSAKSGTIAAIDYFGFPVSVFGADLKRTGWATLVILAILAAITIVTRVS